MENSRLKKLHELEEKIEKLKEFRVRASERLKLLKDQHNQCIEELNKYGIAPKDVQIQLSRMATALDNEIDEIEAQIPSNVEELLGVEDSEDQEEI